MKRFVTLGGVQIRGATSDLSQALTLGFWTRPGTRFRIFDFRAEATITCQCLSPGGATEQAQWVVRGSARDGRATQLVQTVR